MPHSPLPPQTVERRGCSELRPHDSLFQNISVHIVDPHMLDLSLQQKHLEAGSLAMTAPNVHELECVN